MATTMHQLAMNPVPPVTTTLFVMSTPGSQVRKVQATSPRRARAPRIHRKRQAADGKRESTQPATPPRIGAVPDQDADGNLPTIQRGRWPHPRTHAMKAPGARRLDRPVQRLCELCDPVGRDHVERHTHERHRDASKPQQIHERWAARELIAVDAEVVREAIETACNRRKEAADAAATA